jgi:hypothetical protein
MTRAFIVEGRTGEWDDYQDWPVAIFTDRGRAARFAKRANDWLREHGLHADNAHISHYRERREAAGASPYDPQLRVDYTGARYCTVSVPLNPELPRNTTKNGDTS